MHNIRLTILVGLFLVLWIIPQPRVLAQDAIETRCPAGIQARPADFQPGGIILTAFDSQNLWVYDIDRATRYPLPETRPCLSNCRLSPDSQWLTYINPETTALSRMRLDGTQRSSLVAGGASDVFWWSTDKLLIWTPDHRAYLREIDALDVESSREYLPADRLISIQPGGFYGIRLDRANDQIVRTLVNTADSAQPPVRLAVDEPYFNAYAWSLDGGQLLYVGRGAYDETAQIAGAELYLLRPGDAIPRQLTSFSRIYGAVRIGGYNTNALSWSPDGTRVAFWLIELLGPNPAENVGQAQIHVLDVASGQLTAYCGFVTDEHTPNPSSLAWSPDGTHLALVGNVPGDDRGYLLLALNVDSGVFTELSEGVFPALGRPDVTAWGYTP